MRIHLVIRSACICGYGNHVLTVEEALGRMGLNGAAQTSLDSSDATQASASHDELCDSLPQQPSRHIFSMVPRPVPNTRWQAPLQKQILQQHRSRSILELVGSGIGSQKQQQRHDDDGSMIATRAPQALHRTCSTDDLRSLERLAIITKASSRSGQSTKVFKRKR